jgi:putative ABC transport system permease protein
MAAVLNVLGLSVAFAAFVVILMQVNYERSFDTYYPTSDRIYRLELQGAGTFSVILTRAFIEEVIPSSPHIEAGTLINPFITPIYFTITENGEKKGFREAIQTTHPDVVKVFDFPVIEGDPDCLGDPEKVIIPESMAKRMFGDQSAIGKSIHAEEDIWSKGQTNLTIGAVYRDFPGNVQMKNLIYTAIDENFMRTGFTASNYICYLLLDDEKNIQTVVDNFNRHFDFESADMKGESIKLVPVTDIYYFNESQDGRLFRSGNKDVTNLLFFIAILIVIVAIINYTNFSTALTPVRIKSINTQKVLGSPDSLLRRSLVLEAVIISLAAWVISLFIVWVLNKTQLLSFVNADLDLVSNLPVILLSGIIALFTGLIAGIYPAWYMVSFPPALVLKGSFGLSSSGRKLRTALIGIQFIVSIMLITGASMVRLQNDYMRNFSLGFDKDQIAIVKLSGELYQNHKNAYTDGLKQFAGIEDVAFAMEKMGSQDGYSTNSDEYKGQSFHYYMVPVTNNFLRVMGIPVTGGRDFSPADELTENISYIFNREAHERLEMEAGDSFGSWSPGNIIGFTGDVKFTSLRKVETPIAFVTANIPYNLPFSYIRLTAGTDVHAAVDHIRKTLSDIDPSYPFDVEFYDKVYDQLYHKEVNLRSSVTLFSILAIILSLVGVFGLVVFDTQYKRKEIAIRKVHGASISSILAMINKQYVYIVFGCFIIATPIAWYAIKKWLETFAYKTPLYWWVFALAFLIIFLVTTVTITFQSWRAANANPVESIKAE